MHRTPEPNPDGVSFYLLLPPPPPLPLPLPILFLGFYFLFSRNKLQQCPAPTILLSFLLPSYFGAYWGLWLELKFQTIKFDKIPWSLKWNWALEFLTCFKGKVTGSFLVPGFHHMVSSVPTAANFILCHQDNLSYERTILLWEKCGIY